MNEEVDVFNFFKGFLEEDWSMEELIDAENKLNNLDEQTQIEVIKICPIAFKHIKNPSKLVIEEAIKINSYNSRYLKK